MENISSDNKTQENKGVCSLPHLQVGVIQVI